MKTEKVRNNKWGLLRVTCPRCKNRFGLDAKTIECFGEVNIHYKCPYCAYEAGLK